MTQGRAIRLLTRGRRSGASHSVVVGFVEAPGGALLVAASSAGSHWARNLAAHPDCDVEHSGDQRAYRAVRLEGTARNGAVAALILRYGTPSERLGSGPVFRLEPVAVAGARDGRSGPSASTL